MLHSQMQIKAPQTKRIESKQYFRQLWRSRCLWCERTVKQQTCRASDYSLLYNSITTVESFMTALAISNSFMKRSSNTFQRWFCSCLVLWIIWMLIQRSQDDSVHYVLENKLIAVYLGNSLRPFEQFQSSCSNPPPPPPPPKKKVK